MSNNNPIFDRFWENLEKKKNRVILTIEYEYGEVKQTEDCGGDCSLFESHDYSFSGQLKAFLDSDETTIRIINKSGLWAQVTKNKWGNEPN